MGISFDAILCYGMALPQDVVIPWLNKDEDDELLFDIEHWWLKQCDYVEPEYTTFEEFKFIKIDKNYNSVFYKLKSAIDYKVIIALADFVNKKDDTVTIDIHLKKQLADGLGYGIRAIEQSILALKEVNSITPLGRGRYMINPEVIFIGGTVNITNKQEYYDTLRKTYVNSKEEN